MHDLTVSRTDYPCAHRALRGFGRQAPGRERDPMPWDACVLLAADLLDDRRSAEEHHAGGALVLQFDLYARPSEILELVGSSVVSSAGSSPSGVIIRPADDVDEGSVQDLERAQAGLQRARPAKSGRFDGTVLVGECASVQAGRGLVHDFLKALKRARQPNQLLFPFNLATYEKLLNAASARLKLGRLRLTPHTARHGGPSEDCYGGHRDIPAIQSRGRWEHPRSVARYRKPGKLLRQKKLLEPMAKHVRLAHQVLRSRLLRYCSGQG